VRRVRAGHLGSSVAALGIAAGAVLSGPLTGPAFATDNVCEGVEQTTTGGDATGDSLPFDALGIRRAQEVVDRLAPRGRPVGVAVLDSGVYGDVRGDGPIPIVARYDVTKDPDPPHYYHGTAVAGLIAGRDRSRTKPVGFAPHARIIDVRVYDTDKDGVDENSAAVSADALAQGLEWVARNAETYNIKVANVSLALHDVDAVEEAVQRVRKAHVIVVASTGNRPVDDSDEFAGEFASADEIKSPLVEDAATHIFPAGYDDVIAVNSTDGGAEGSSLVGVVLKNSQTDVAVPTAGGISYGLNGDACTVGGVATSWAAAEVSGILALLCERYPDDTAQQTMARLVDTANGLTDDPTPLTGAGVVQPYEALTRPLEPKKNGDVEQATTQESGDETKATAPDPEPDLLASVRDDAVWWGLIGGGTLVVALLLRPVLARRRP
jgi:membrane-anchored mycosin MYCP